MEKLTDLDKLKIYQAEYNILIDEIKTLAHCKDLLELENYTLDEVIKTQNLSKVLIAKIKTQSLNKIDEERVKKLEVIINNIMTIIDSVDDELLRVILRLKIIENKTYREIGKITNFNFSAVRKKYKNFIKG